MLIDPIIKNFDFSNIGNKNLLSFIVHFDKRDKEASNPSEKSYLLKFPLIEERLGWGDDETNKCVKTIRSRNYARIAYILIDFLEINNLDKTELDKFKEKWIINGLIENPLSHLKNFQSNLLQSIKGSFIMEYVSAIYFYYLKSGIYTLTLPVCIPFIPPEKVPQTEAIAFKLPDDYDCLIDKLTKPNKFKMVFSYLITNLLQLFLTELFFIIQNNLVVRICQNCGHVFISGKKYKYCKSCKPRSKSENIKILREISKRDNPLTKICETCKEPFTPTRKDRKYCSVACRRGRELKKKEGDNLSSEP